MKNRQKSIVNALNEWVCWVNLSHILKKIIMRLICFIRNEDDIYNCNKSFSCKTFSKIETEEILLTFAIALLRKDMNKYLDKMLCRSFLHPNFDILIK